MKNKIPFTITFICACLLAMATLVSWVNKPVPVNAATVQAAALKSMAILQRSGYVFTANSQFKCTSCHNNTLLAMAAGIAREKNVPLVDSFTAQRVNAMAQTIQIACNPNHVNEFVPANFIAPYILLGLNAENYKPNVFTDITVDYLLSQAKPNGTFLTESGRNPLETGEAHLTAMAMRSILLYASPGKAQQVAQVLAKSKEWLLQAKTEQQQELVFQLLGLHWCGCTKAQQTDVFARLLLLQRPDGGWAQLPTMKSDAYATGQALYALYESGMMKTDDPVYQRGLQYLLNTQNEEGAWVVQTRSYPIQKFVDSGFPPYDDNQFISAAASNWATMALLLALPDKPM